MTNTTPFWASIFAYLVIKESVSKLEVVAMLISFGAVVIITLVQANSIDEDDIQDDGGDKRS